MVSREKELQMMEDFIKKNGVTKLPPDDRFRLHSSKFWKDKTEKADDKEK